jgi:Flp pilus assembly protein TadD
MFMSQDKSITRDPRVELFISVTLVLMTLLVYCPSFDYPFVNYDDPAYVYENPRVLAGLTADGVGWAFTTFECGNWHPLTWLSLQLDCTLYGGPKSGGFHLTNVLLHTVNTLLLFLVLGRMTGMVWRSAVVAALFALHPLHVESVAWVAERKDVLSTLFWMLALVAYLFYLKRPGLRRYLLVMLALVLGLLAKPMLVTLPCVLLLLDYWPLRRWQSAASCHHLVQEKLPLFALVLASCAVTFCAQLHGQAVAPFEAFPMTARLGNALLAYTAYLGKMLWPLGLAAYYPHSGASASVAQTLAAGLLLVALTVLVLGPGRRWPYLAVGWLWYLGTLVPVIGLVQVGGQAMADRYTYVPLIGLFVLLTWGATDLATAWRLPRPYLVAAALLVLAACAALTWNQVGCWKSTRHLWERAALVTENNVLAHMNLGVCYQDEGRISDAKSAFENAVTIAPHLAEPHVNLGNVFGDLGLWARAEREYRAAIDLAPQLAGAHFSLGNALAQLGRREEAIGAFRRAIDLNPGDPGPHNNLAIQLGYLGRLEEAASEYRAAIELNPANASVHCNLGVLLAQLGRHEEALAECRRAIALDPKDARFHNQLAQLLQENGQLEEALAEYRKSLELGDKQVRGRLQACERLRALRPRLAGLVAGRDQPANNAERLAFADLCRQPGERRYALAARLYTDAFDADPQLARDWQSANRFNAACAAAAAGCGQGEGDAGLNEQRKFCLRRQALNWLHADLALWKKQAHSDKLLARDAVGQVLGTWLYNANLAGVRDPAAIARLAEAERQVWQKLWHEVKAVLAQANSPQGSHPLADQSPPAISAHGMSTTPQRQQGSESR